MADKDEQPRRKPPKPGKGRAGEPAGGGPRRRRGRDETTGQPRGGAGGRARRDDAPARRPSLPHTLKLEVGGHGVELHCDTCDLVVTHLAAPQVRRAVEEAHRRHLGSLAWESAWVAVCSCGWRTGRLGQQAARDALAAHEASVLLPAARGEGQGPTS